jgi:polyribonucleotide nucleotidyltransferase
MFQEITKSAKYSNGTITFSTGKLARQADGAVVVTIGDAYMLCTVTADKKPATGGGHFFPLTVHYQEKIHSVGRIPGGYIKREGKASEKEVLVSRLIDRAIRPLFNDSFVQETNVICTLHSHDSSFQPDILALNGASAALAISGLPYEKIVAATRVAKVEDKFIVNPTFEEMCNSSLDLIVAGTRDSIVMVESEADFLSEEEMLSAIKIGHQELIHVIDLIEELASAVNKPKLSVTELFPDSLKNEIKDFVHTDLDKAFEIKGKQARNATFDALSKKVAEYFLSVNNLDNYSEQQIALAFEAVKSDFLRHTTIVHKRRIDGRNASEIRPIKTEVGFLPKTHGSALFTRGETQALVSATLGTTQDSQTVDALDGEYKESFLVNYIFPQYAVGEVGPLRAPSRREMGHAKLAWRALNKSLPKIADFPYNLRIVSEITECNGSSSMATVCGTSMALMNAGVPLKEAVAGIAMGLIKEENNFVILSDILGDEDHLGDMDFKVAGGTSGITALQMDIKVAGIGFDIISKALEQAKHGRIHILECMVSEVSSISVHAPMIQSFKISRDKIRDVIGAGGKIIREICEQTGAKIDISDNGDVQISAIGKDKMDAAIKRIKDIAFEPEVGTIFTGTVVKIIESGAFINFVGSRDGFVHISEISHTRIASVNHVLQEGQEVKVKLIGFDRGKAKLTIKGIDGAAAPEVAANNENVQSNIATPSDELKHKASSDDSDNHDAAKKKTKKKWTSSNNSAPQEVVGEIVKEKKYFN